MIILAALLAVAAAGQQPAEAAPGDIVVTAERLRKVRWSFHADKQGYLTDCTVTRPSGDAIVDTAVCEATRQCADQGLRNETAIADCAVPLAKRLVLGERATADRPVR